VPLDHLCLSGGVALNCVTNELVRRSGDFADVFIPSAPHDAGTAVGAALVVHCAKQKKPPERGNSTPYLGPAFNRREILAAVKSAGLKSRRSKAPARDAADMIADGKVVAWFQGRMEFGPRALGNRSLLADPRRPDMRNILNQKIKHRESFRPFAPSVMAEHADEWFEVGSHATSHEFMLFACGVKAERRDCIPAVVHQDGSARLQLVRRESNPHFHELLSCLFARTGVPLVINTSFTTTSPSSARPPMRSSRSASLALMRCLWTMSISRRKLEAFFLFRPRLRPSISLQSTLRLQGLAGLPCRNHCSLAPTRLSNDRFRRCGRLFQAARECHGFGSC
jgi:carbamoyltransferase